MTTPTPAQIEAAAKATYRAHCIRHGHRFDWEQSAKRMWMDYAKAALAAAAEVDTMANPVARLDAGGANFAPQAALTAAGEVGDTEQLLTECVRERENYNGAHQAACLEIERLKRELAATIERCAQVADKMAADENVVWKADIAAAIRALKDKP